jgi:hypothetical protein
LLVEKGDCSLARHSPANKISRLSGIPGLSGMLVAGQGKIEQGNFELNFCFLCAFAFLHEMVLES